MSKFLSVSARRWVAFPFLVAVLLLGAAGRAQAVDTGHNGVIAAGEVVDDDVVLAAQQVRVDGTVNGMLLASGQDVVINGTVNGDVVIWTNTATVNGVINGNLFAAGASLVINAPVKGSAFLAGYTLNLGPKTSVERNVFSAGYSLITEPGSQVGTDLLAAGYQASLDGGVGRDVLADGAALELHGRVGRNLKVNVAAPSDQEFNPTPQIMGPSYSVRTLAPGLRVSDGAVIGGKLTYTSSANQDSAVKAAPAGGLEYIYKEDTTQPQPAKRVDFVNLAVTAIVGAGRDFLTLMALGSLALYFLPALVARVLPLARQKPLPSAAWGFAVFLVAYAAMGVAAVLLLILGILLGVVTFGGLANVVFGVGFSALGLAAAGFSVLVAYGSKLVVVAVVGHLVLRSLAPRFAENRYWALVAGVLLYVVLRDLPGIIPVVGQFFGGLVGVAVTLVGLGAMWLAFREWRAAAKPPTSAAPVAPPA